MKHTSPILAPSTTDLRLTKRGAVTGFTIAVLCMTIVVATLVDIVEAHPLRISTDAAMFLEIGRMILDGKIPYVDFFELNPPLVLYVHSALYAITKLIPAPEPLAFNLLVILFFVTSLAVATTILWKNRDHAESALFPPLLVSFSLVTFFFSTCVVDFGQREHLFVLAFFPYLLIRWLRSMGRPVPTVLGVACSYLNALTACFKPHFLFLVLAFETSLFLQTRNAKLHFKNGESIVLPAVLALYALFILLMPQGAKDGYFGFVLETYRLGYDAYAGSLTSLLVGSLNEFRYAMYLTVASLAVALILQKRSTLLAPLTAVTVAGFIIYLLQGNIWVNRAMPMLAGSIMLTGIEFGIIVNSFAGSFKTAAKVCSITIAVLLLGAFVWQQRIRQHILAEVPNRFSLSRIGFTGDSPPIAWTGADLILDETKEHDPVLFMSTLIEPAYPTLMQLKRESASRYLHGMPLTALWYARENASSSADREKAKLLCTNVLQDYYHDIQKNKPKLIFVKQKVIAPLIDEDSKLKALFSTYKKLEPIDGHDVYIIQK